MSQVRIILIRHGQDEDNAQGILNGLRDTALTRLGRSQARTVGQGLKSEEITAVYSSPLRRARQTAKIIIGQINRNVPLYLHRVLIERDFGVLTGKSKKEISRFTQKTFQGKKVTYFLEGERIETFSEVLLRVRPFVVEMKQKYPDRTVLVVTHGDVGMMIRAAYYEWSWQKGLMASYLGNAEPVELKEGR